MIRRKITSLVLLIPLVMLLPILVMAQQRTITGTVKSANGNIVIDRASVKVVGTDRGTVTDANGNFSITASTGEVLEFTGIGFVSKQQKVNSSSTYDIVMASDEKVEQEVVVVGYGTQRKTSLTGAVSTVDVKKTLAGRPIADVGRGLQGAASGLSVVIPSGEIGSDPIIKIRGQIGSLQGGSSPLILLDNVEIPSIQLVNPNDIASITVLKDAASASNYGSKASFGVILITTKKGAAGGKPQINYSNNFSWQNVWKDLQLADVNGLKYTVDAAERIGTTTPVGAFYLVDRASYLKAVEWKQKYGGTVGPNDPTVFGRDWFVNANGAKMGVRTYDPYDLMVKEWAPTQQHNLSVGFTEGKTSYNVGLGLLDQSGMMKPAKADNFSRYNASLRISSDLNKYVTLRAGAIYSRRKKEYAYITNSTTADPWLY